VTALRSWQKIQMLHGVYPEILHFVQDDERRVQHDTRSILRLACAVT
jgi:hypothetical protein